LLAQVLHRLRLFSLIGPRRPHPEHEPGAAARAKQVAHTGPSAVLDLICRTWQQEMQGAVLRRRQQDPHTG
jgi:hypothetical protein